MMRLTASASLLVLAAFMSAPAAAQSYSCPGNAKASAALFASPIERPVSELLSLAKCPDPVAKEFALSALGNAEPTIASIDAIIAGLSDSSDVVRRQAFYALKRAEAAGRARLADWIVSDDARDPGTPQSWLQSPASVDRIAAFLAIADMQQRTQLAAHVKAGGVAQKRLAEGQYYTPPRQYADAPKTLPRNWRDQMAIGQFCSAQNLARTRKKEAQPVEEALVTALLRGEDFQGWDIESLSTTFCTRTEIGPYAVELLGYFDRDSLRRIVDQNLATADSSILRGRDVAGPLGFTPPQLAEFLVASLNRTGKAGTLWADLTREFFKYKYDNIAGRYVLQPDQTGSAKLLIDAIAAHWATIAPEARAELVGPVLDSLAATSKHNDLLDVSLASPLIQERYAALIGLCGQGWNAAQKSWSVSGSCRPAIELRASDSQSGDLQPGPTPAPTMAQAEFSHYEAETGFYVFNSAAARNAWLRPGGRPVPDQVIIATAENPDGGWAPPPPPPPPPPPAPPPVGPETVSLPPFPWPIPRPVRFEPLDSGLFGRDPTLDQVYQRLRSSVFAASNGYEIGLFSGPPNGFVLLASTERIRVNGVPYDEPRRWTRSGNPQANFMDMLNNLRFERPGYFRAIAFVVADSLQIDSKQSIASIPIDNLDARELPSALGAQRLGARKIYAVVYAFQITQASIRIPWKDGAPTARQHLIAAGIGPQLGIR